MNNVCDVIIGADHGQGAVRCSLKIHILSPSEHQRKYNSSLVSRTFPWAHISCKKDTHTILALLNKATNKAIHQLKLRKVIGIRDENDTIVCVIIERNAIELNVIANDDNQTILTYSIENETQLMTVNDNSFIGRGEHVFLE